MNNSWKDNFAISIPFIAVIVFYFIAGRIGNVEILSLISVVLIQFLIFVIGVFLRILLKVDSESKDTLQCIFESYGIGFVFSIILYIILVATKLQKYTNPIFLAFMFATIFFTIRETKYKKLIVFKMKKTSASAIVLCTVAIIACCTYRLFVFQFYNLVPGQGGSTNYYCDSLFWMENCVAATKGFPLPLMHFSGYELHYHYFSSIFCAFMKMSTGAEMYNLCFDFSYIWESFLLVGSVYVLFRGVLKKDIYVWIAEFLLLFSTGREERTGIIYIHHVYNAPFGYSLGMSLGMLSFYYFYEVIKKRNNFSFRENFGLYLTSLLTFGCAFGAKSAIGAILLVGVAIYCVHTLVSKKNLIKGLIIGVSFLACFILVYVIFIRSASVAAFGGKGGGIGIEGILSKEYYQVFFGRLSSIVGNVIAGIMVIIKYVVDSQPAIYLLLLVSFIFKILCKSKINILELILMGIIIIGCVVTICIPMSGSSNMYFMMGAEPYALFMALEIIAINSENIIRNAQKFAYSLYGFIVGTGLFCFLTFSFNYYGFSQGELMISGLKLYLNRGSEEIISYLSDNNLFYNATKDEYDALTWIRKNTNEDAIVIANNGPDFRGVETIFPIVEAFTERQSYYNAPAVNAFSNLTNIKVEEKRKELVSEYYNNQGKNESARKKLVEAGVDYSITYKRYPHIDSIGGDLVYENNEISIIKLKIE